MVKAVKYLILPLLLLAILAAYWVSLPSAFHLDDFDTIINSNLMDARLGHLVRTYPTRWLVFLSYWLNLRPGVTDQLAKFFDPACVQLVSLHLTNLAIHALNSWLVYLISLPLLIPARLRERLDKASPGVHLAAAAVAFFFALHPLQTQPVIYISQRFTLLSGLCYFGSLFFVTRAFFCGWKKLPATIAAVACFIVGLFCKETIITAPVSCLALLWLFSSAPGLKYQRRDQWRRLLIWAALALVLCVILPALVFFQLNHWNYALIVKSFRAVGGTGIVDMNVEGLNRYTYFLSQPYVILYYVMLFLCPTMLCVDHDIPLCTTPLSGQFLFPFAILLFLAGLAVYFSRKRPLLSWGLFFFVFPLLPQSSIMPTLDLSFEHRMYLSVAGLLWICADLAAMLKETLPRSLPLALKIAVPVLLLLCAYGTYERSKVWKSELTLWGDAMTKSDGKQRVVLNFASAFFEETGDATNTVILVNHYMKRTSEKTGQPLWHKVHPRMVALLGNAHRILGNTKTATMCYQLAVDLEKNNMVFRYNLAALYLATNKQGLALAQTDRMEELNPEYADTYYIRGIIQRRLSRREAAKKSLEKYLQMAPHGEYAEDARMVIQRLEEGK